MRRPMLRIGPEAAGAEKRFGITPEAVEAVKEAREKGAATKIVPLRVEAAAA